MSVIEFQTRPIDTWPGALTKNRKRAPFSASWGVTVNHLDRELQHLKAEAVVFLMALEPHEIRIDGRPRAGAVARHPGVILSFESKGKPLRFPCDTYDHWQGNVRAIGLTLELLRRIDNYGVTRKAEQYMGWAALPGPGESATISNRDDAMAVLRRVIGNRADVLPLADAIRECERITHPDRGGNSDEFKRVQAARAVLLNGA